MPHPRTHLGGVYQLAFIHYFSSHLRDIGVHAEGLYRDPVHRV